MTECLFSTLSQGHENRNTKLFGNNFCDKYYANQIGNEAIGWDYSSFITNREITKLLLCVKANVTAKQLLLSPDH